MKVVIQCGGRGTRLMPYTTILPKPLMPVGSQPVLELLLKWLRRQGADEILITTGYLGHLIRTVCGDGQQWDMRITYTEEMEPLGTIGALSLLRDRLDTRFLVINGDVLTNLNLGAFIAAHRARRSIMTIATVTRSTRLDFGLIEAQDDRVTRFKEKPLLSYRVSMGVYCMEPEILPYIPSGVPFGFDDLVLHLLEHAVPVSTYNHDGTWLDVGRVDDFRKAQELNWDDQPRAHESVAAE